MHIPDIFKETRAAEISRIIEQYPLASIVAHTEKGLIANHIPLMHKNEHILIGHMALENEMYHLVQTEQDILCIFTAENAYISANDYPSKLIDHQKVPTWNYQAVHIAGKIHYFTDQKRKLAALGQLTKYHEQKTNGDRAWKMSDAPKDYLLEQLEQLVVFEIHIDEIQAKSKLSQNREAVDFHAVIKALQQRQEIKLAHAMQDL
jgi:transcriptional regulator